MKNIFGLVLAMVVACAGLQAAEEQEGHKPWFHLEFKGGTAQELVKAMREGFEKTHVDPPPINVLIPEDLKEIRMPSIQMRKVDARAVFESINLMSRNAQVQWLRSADNVWVLHRMPDQRKNQPFFVGDLLTKFKIVDITTAVRTTWEMGEEERARKPELKYHEDTQMLVARADKEQLESMSEVLEQLRMSLQTLRRATAP